MKPVTLELAEKNGTYNADLTIDNGFIVFPAQTDSTAELIALLREWGYTELFTDEPAGAAEHDAVAPSTDQASQENSPVSPDEQSAPRTEMLDRALADAAAAQDEAARLAAVKRICDEYSAYINHVYTHYATHGDIDQKELAVYMEKLCHCVSEYRNDILRIKISETVRSKNFLIVHSFRSTLFAIIIAQQLNTPLDRQIEIATACVLHEIGMIQIPPQMYITDKHLTQSDRTQLSGHTVIGYNIVKDLGFPLSVQLGVFEHHEKENGSGYPRHLPGSKISVYAKIIAVACAFEAMTAPREFRDERSPFDAMLEMIKNNKSQYDEIVVKALLYAISLYPVGSYVHLNGGKIGRVIAVSPDNPKKPIVQLVGQHTAHGEPVTVPVDDTENKILRALTKEETNDILKTIESA